MKKKCIICKKEFFKSIKDGIPQWNRRIFCGRKCYWESLKGKISLRKNGLLLDCKICLNKFYVADSRKDIAKYCSKKCLGKSKIGKIPSNVWRKGYHASKGTEFKKGMIPPMKGKKFTDEHRKRLSESHLKSTKQRLETHYNWQGGKSFVPYTKEFHINLKRKIRERDGYRCTLCRKSEDQELKELKKVLAVDHINGIKEDCSHENLRTLCCSCNSIEMQKRRKSTKRCVVTK